MGILKTRREKDLMEAAELRKAAKEFEQNNDRPTVEKHRRTFEPMLERAEMLEKKHGVVPGGSAVIANQASAPVANSSTGVLTTRRDRELAEAGDLHRAVADQEKQDPDSVRKNRPFFEGMLNRAEALEKMHGVAPRGSLVAINSAAGSGGASGSGNTLHVVAPLVFDTANAQDLGARLQVVTEAVKQGRIMDIPEVKTGWLIALKGKPEDTLHALNDLPAGQFNRQSNATHVGISQQFGLTNEQQAICGQLGISEEQFMAAQRR